MLDKRCPPVVRHGPSRVKYQRAPMTADWMVGAHANTRDGIVAAEKLGAALDVMEDAWWGTTIPLPNRPWFALQERNAPGSRRCLRGGQVSHVRRHLRPGTPPG